MNMNDITYKPLYDTDENLIDLEIGGVYLILVWRGSSTDAYTLQPVEIVIVDKTDDASFPYTYRYKENFDLGTFYLSYPSDEVSNKIGYDVRLSDEYKAAETLLAETKLVIKSAQTVIDYAGKGSVSMQLGWFIDGCQQKIVDLEAKLEKIISESQE